MSVYTPTSRTDQEAIMAQYGIKVVETIEISGGNANSNFRIESENASYMLTLMEEKSFQEVKALVQILQWLHQHKFPTTQIIPTLKGKISTQFSNLPVLVKPWISGEVIEDLSHHHLTQVGAAMAQLHTIPIPIEIPLGHPYGKTIFPKAFQKGIDTEYEAWLEKSTAKLEQQLPKGLPTGLIHGDIFYDNVLFQDGKLQAIIDFEEVCHYQLAFDLGMGILGLCQSEGQINPEKISPLVSGYESIRPLEKAEKDSLPLFIQYAAMATSFWRYWRYNVHAPNPERSHLHREMMNLAISAENLK